MKKLFILFVLLLSLRVFAQENNNKIYVQHIVVEEGYWENKQAAFNSKVETFLNTPIDIIDITYAITTRGEEVNDNVVIYSAFIVYRKKL